jgi:transposase
MMTQHTIGINISKEHLDAYRSTDGTSRRFVNSKAGHKGLIT